MNNKEQTKKISSLEFEKENQSNDYKFLIHKLKTIKESINLLEKNFLQI
tara:strand:+ start:58 stop:204 length:147 start_codon:yes stop_codon:yes gene_type:complete